MLARSGMLVLILGGICALSAAPPAPAAPGDLDPTFGGDGSVATDVGGERYPVRKRLQDVALQADGKIVVAGWVGDKAGFAVARYETDGTLDPDFAGDGVAITTFAGASSAAEGVAIQADGKIVAAGYAGGSFALVRYQRNGKLDSSFGGDGKVKTDLTAGTTMPSTWPSRPTERSSRADDPPGTGAGSGSLATARTGHWTAPQQRRPTDVEPLRR